jgi:hypothetical protein
MTDRRFDPADREITVARIAAKDDAYARILEPARIAEMPARDAVVASAPSPDGSMFVASAAAGAPDLSQILDAPAGMPTPPSAAGDDFLSLYRSVDFGSLALARPDALTPAQMPAEQKERMVSGLQQLMAEDKAAEGAALRRSLYDAIGTSPEQTAEYLRLQKLFGGDLEYIARNEAEMRKQLGFEDIKSEIDYTPTLAARLVSDPTFAKLAHDHVPELAKQETWWDATVRQVTHLPEALLHGWTEAEMAEYGAQQVSGDPLTMLPTFVTDRPEVRRAVIEDYARQLDALGEPSGTILIGAATIAEMLYELKGEIVPAIAGGATGAGMGLVIGAPTGPGAAVTTTTLTVSGASMAYTAASFEQAYRQSAGAVYARAILDGVGEEEARDTAFAMGVVLAPIQFAMDKLLAPIGIAKTAGEKAALKELADRRFAEAIKNPTVRAAAGRIAKHSLSHVGRVTATGAVMSVGFEAANEAARNVGGLEMRMSSAQGRREIVDNVVNNTLYMMQAGVAMHIAMPGSHNLIYEVFRERQRLDMAKTQVRALERLNDIAVGTKLAKRAPGENASLVNEAAAAAGSKDVYISKAGLKQVLEGMGVPLERMNEIVPGAWDQFNDQSQGTVEDGGWIKVSAGDYTNTVARTGIGAKLMRHVTFDLDVDTLDVMERKERQRQEMLADMPAANARNEEMVRADAERADDADKVLKPQLDQLRAAGFSEEQVGFAAMIMRGALVTEARTRGISVAEVQAQRGLRIDAGARIATERARVAPGRPVPATERPAAAAEAAGAPTAAPSADAALRATEAPQARLSAALEAHGRLAADVKDPDVRRAAVGLRDRVGGLAEAARAAIRSGDPAEARRAAQALEDAMPATKRERDAVGQKGLSREIEQGAREMAAAARDHADAVERAAKAERPAEGARLEQAAMSTRVPTAKGTEMAALNDMLLADWEAMKNSDELIAKNLEKIDALELPFVRDTSLSPRAQVEKFIDWVGDNLGYLYDKMDPEQRERAKLWYVGARRLVDYGAERYGITDMQAAAMLAVLSPQKNWFENVSMMFRIADLMTAGRDERWSKEMNLNFERLVANNEARAPILERAMAREKKPKSPKRRVVDETPEEFKARKDKFEKVRARRNKQYEEEIALWREQEEELKDALGEAQESGEPTALLRSDLAEHRRDRPRAPRLEGRRMADTDASFAERKAQHKEDLEAYKKRMARFPKTIAAARKKGEDMRALSNSDRMNAMRAGTLGDVLAAKDYELAGYFIRMFDEEHNDRSFGIITPEGGVGGPSMGKDKPMSLRWGSYNTIRKAISIYEDGRAENVHHQIGMAHKVRNFYNNMFDPSNADAATIDTHAIAAGLLMALSASDDAVSWGLGSGASDARLGLHGGYAILFEAYKRTAEEKGILAREMQSITWEAIRGLFEAAMKKTLKPQINAIWARHKADPEGFTIKQARAEIFALAGGITTPEWVKLSRDLAPAPTYEGRGQQLMDAMQPKVREQMATPARVALEVRPAASDAATVAAFDALAPDRRLEVSRAVAADVVRKVLKEFGIAGGIEDAMQRGPDGLGGSLVVGIQSIPIARQVASALRYVLGQAEARVVSDVQFQGAEPIELVVLSLQDGTTPEQVAALDRDVLAPLGVAEVQVIGGAVHVVVPEGMDAAAFSDTINAAVAGDARVKRVEQTDAWRFVDAGETDDTRGTAGAVQRRRLDLLRDEAGRLVADVVARESDERGRNRGGQREVRSLAPLEGAPAARGATGPDPRIVAVAERYAESIGVDLKRQASYARVDEDLARRIAGAYEAMPHDPQDPRVKEAYENLIAQTIAQYRALEAAGYKFWFYDDATDPYGGNPYEAMRDLRATQSMAVYSTEAGFGNVPPRPDNAMLADTGIMWPYGAPDGPLRRVLANDLFRAVHDAFGHSIEGAGFREHGEENAWQAHVRLYTGSAVGAVTSETRGQNLWLNYGPAGESNRTASVEDTVFAEQKTGLMPEWTWTEGRVGDMPAADRAEPPVLEQSARPQPHLYSALARAVDAVDAKAMTGEGWRERLRGAVGKGEARQDEIDWTGLDDFLSLPREGKITKQEVLRFLAENGVKVETEVLADTTGSFDVERETQLAALETAETWLREEYLWTDKVEAAIAFGRDLYTRAQSQEDVDANLDKLIASQNTIDDALESLGTSLDQYYDDAFENRDTESTAKFSGWTIKGGTNYREMVVRIPGYEGNSAHFDNAVAHMRVQDVTVNGRRMLQVVELQSDLAQQGREKGFRNKGGREALAKRISALRAESKASRAAAEEALLKIDNMGFESFAEARHLFISELDWRKTHDLTGLSEAEIDAIQRHVYAIRSERAANNEMEQLGGSKLEAAPFVAAQQFAVFKDGKEVTYKNAKGKESIRRYPSVEEAQKAAAKVDGEARDIGMQSDTEGWLNLLLKQAILEAVNNGYDGVVISNGDQQVELYKSALTEAASTVMVKRNEDGTYDFASSKDVEGPQAYLVGGGSTGVPWHVYMTPEQANKWNARDISEESMRGAFIVIDGERQDLWGYLTSGAEDTSEIDLADFDFDSDAVVAEGMKLYTIGDRYVYMSEAEAQWWNSRFSDPTALRADRFPDAFFLMDGERVYLWNAITAENGSSSYGDIRDNIRSGGFDFDAESEPMPRQEVPPAAPSFSEQGVDSKRIAALVGGNAAREIVAKADAAPGETVSIDTDTLNPAGQGMVQFYDQIVPATLAKLLKKLGATVGAEDVNGERNVAFDVTPEMRDRIAAQGGLPLMQASRRDEPRGEIDLATMLMKLGSGADFSTFTHEFTHYVTERMRLAVESGTATDQQRADLDVLLRWNGINGVAEWSSLTPQRRVEFYEAVAYGMEEHAATGKAPTPALEGAFARIRQWMLEVYRDVRVELNAIYRAKFGKDLPMLTDEVRGVMDRMLFAEDTIRAAEESRDMKPMFQSKEEALAAGMTDGEWAAFQEMQQEAHDAAVGKLASDSIRQMQWLGNARSRLLKDMQRRNRGLREEMREKVEEEVAKEPVYRAMDFLKRGMVVSAEGERVPAEVASKLDVGAVKAVLGDEAARLGYGKYGMLQKDGMHPDMAAELFGFRGGEELLRALLAARKPDDEIEARTDARMMKEHGDLNDPDRLDAAVTEALHNEARARFVAVELRFLSKATQPVPEMIRAAREAAAEHIGGRRIRDIKPSEFVAAESRFARDAMRTAGMRVDPETAGKAAGTRAYNEAIARGADEATAQAARAAAALEGAARAQAKLDAHRDTYGDRPPAEVARRAKQQQLFQNQLAAEAARARREVADTLRDFRKFFKPDAKIGKSREIEMILAARAILSAFGIGRSDRSPAEFMAQVREFNPELYAALEPIIQRSLMVGAKSYKDLTLAEFRAVRDGVEALWTDSRRDRQVIVDGRRVAVEQVVGELNARLTAIGVPGVGMVAGEQRAPTLRDKMIRTVNGVKNMMRRVEHWAHTTDGGDGGPFTKYLFQPVKQALEAYRADRNVYMRRYADLLETVDVQHGMIDAPELGYTFGAGNGGYGKLELLGALLHSGNDSNLRKLLVGRNWGALDASGTLDSARWVQFVNRMVAEGRLTKADFDFAQSVWDLNEELKPLAQRTHRALYGFYFKEVEATPLNTPFGSYRGGYVPAKVDPFMVKDAQVHAKLDALEGDFRQVMPSTGLGFTKARTEYNRPLALDVRMIGKHIDDVLRFSHVQPAIKDAMRILRNPEFASALSRMDPTAIEGMLIPWLNRAAKHSVTEPGRSAAVDKFWSVVRARTSLAFMTLNLRQLGDIGGIAPAMQKVAPSQMSRALKQYMSSPQDTAAMIAGLSPMMNERLTEQLVDTRDRLEEILTQRGKVGDAVAFTRRHGTFLNTVLHNQMDITIWLGAYNERLGEIGSSVTDAEAQREAIAHADAVIRMTQGSLLPEDVPAFEAGTPFYRTMTQFASYLNTMANLNLDEYTKIVREVGVRKGAGRLLKAHVLCFMVPAVVFEAIIRAVGGRYGEDEDESWIEQILATFFGAYTGSVPGMIPFGTQVSSLGGIVAAKVQGERAPFGRESMAVSPVIETIGSGAAGTADAVHRLLSDEELKGKNVKDTMTLMSLITGIPLTPIGRAAGYETDVERGEIEPKNAVDYVRGLLTGSTGESTRR